MILVTGATGFLGKEMMKELQGRGLEPLIGVGSKYDLRDEKVCADLVSNVDIVIHLAARVGGIGSNMECPAEFFYENLKMGMNLIHHSFKAGVRKFVCVGSVCSYPKEPPIPFREEDFWNGYPEETNAPYGIAKKALLSMLKAYNKQYGFKSCYPILTNLYGKGDMSDHVIPDMIRKFKRSKKNVLLWGTGQAGRDFLHVSDAAKAIIMLMLNQDTPEPINIGSNEEVTMRELAEMISKLTKFKGGIKWDDEKPDGQPRRKLDISKITEMGWKPLVSLEEGLKEMI